MNDDTRRLEEKIAYLEHHVTEQDKVMLEFSEELARLRREVALLALRQSGGAGGAGGGESDLGSLADERPPHY